MDNNSSPNRWFSMVVDWQKSEWLLEERTSVRLAWVSLIEHVKKVGRQGKAKVRPRPFAREYNIPRRSVDRMLKIAREDGAIEYDGTTVTICNWYTYQDPYGAGKSEKPKESRKSGKSKKAPLPRTTDHRPQTTEPRMEGGSSTPSHPDPPTGADSNGDPFSEIDQRLALWKGCGLTVSESYQFRSRWWKAIEDDPPVIHGEPVDVYEFGAMVVDNAIDSEAPYQVVRRALAYLNSVTERCRREQLWPGEFEENTGTAGSQGQDESSIEQANQEAKAILGGGNES